jgi:4-hydroxy-3-methylbut-2-enyl diphosphate reductase
MDITKITPQGFCKGVLNAIRIVNNVVSDEATIKPIYMLGAIVHNKYVVEAFKNKGVIILEGSSRLEMLDQIESGTVILTAHGVSEKVIEKAMNKGLNVVNAVCKDVSRTHELIKGKLDEGYKVLFFGKLNHPETEGVLGISDEIIVIYDDTIVDDLPYYSGKMLLTNQTTMSYLDVIKKHESLLSKFPQLELVEEVCSATRLRQAAVINSKDRVDLLIVVGDPKSNNSRMLAEVGKNKAHLKSIMIQDANELSNYDFSDYRRIGVTAGASTPSAIVNDIIKTLESNNSTYVNHLTDDDYLTK